MDDRGTTILREITAFLNACNVLILVWRRTRGRGQKDVPVRWTAPRSPFGHNGVPLLAHNLHSGGETIDLRTTTDPEVGSRSNNTLIKQRHPVCTAVTYWFGAWSVRCERDFAAKSPAEAWGLHIGLYDSSKGRTQPLTRLYARKQPSAASAGRALMEYRLQTRVGMGS